MSIVYDYLKQIQATKESEAPVVPVRDVSMPKIEVVRKKNNWRLIVFLFMGGIFVAAGAYVFIVKGEASLAGNRPVRIPKPSVAVSHVVTPPAAPVVAGIVLEGIIYNPTQPFAILNGQMIEPKGRIGDYEVTSIAPDSVIVTNLKDQTTRKLDL
ncbi:MAG TPA: hypothetical protein PLL75_06880 [Candidatus Omnitrophota bacterium]|nr:hypothetical protein [Candidatus Omnitrophota bacterium]HPS37430.1 hypothetical protein [Candidatus Omnitrophota bacterium]